MSWYHTYEEHPVDGVVLLKQGHKAVKRLLRKFENTQGDDASVGVDLR